MLPEDVPFDVTSALAASRAAEAVFVQLPHSHREQYLLWVTETKRPETRARRIAGMIDRLKASGNE